MTDNPLLTLARAYNFAAAKHVDQRRKGEAAEPYLNHLTEVAELVARATEGSEPDIIIAAILHDTVEDTATTLAEIEAAFGAPVAGMVAEVTDDKSLPEQTRKALQIVHAAHASRGARIIKLADKTSNIRALATSPPRGWSAERRMEYIAWGKQVVEVCRSANPWLAAEFDTAARQI